MGAMRDQDRALLSLFADELRAARVRAGLSRVQLAERLGYSPSLVTLIETGHRVPQPALPTMSEQTSLRPAATLPTILSNADTYNATAGDTILTPSRSPSATEAAITSAGNMQRFVRDSPAESHP